MTELTHPRSCAIIIRHRGATLIEVLVSVVVLAIGLLGMAGMQTQSLKGNHSAHLRSQATLLAADVADRIRARADTAIAAGAYADGSADPDRADWDRMVVALLGQGAVGNVANIGGRRFRVTITWADERGCIRNGAGHCTEPDAGMLSFVYDTEI